MTYAGLQCPQEAGVATAQFTAIAAVATSRVNWREVPRELPVLTATEIRARVNQRPFVPFRVVTSSGQTYEVRHPELILVGRRELTIGRPGPRDPTIYQGVDRVSALCVTALEDMEVPPAPPSANGQAQGEVPQ